MVTSTNPTGRLFTVTVVAFRDNGNTMLADFETEVGSDAFDYAMQAQGYFRFAVTEMDARKIEVAVEFADEMIELIQITRD